ncbi:hypothetical protein FO519_004914 [Halicephalobus sp. NKZ332]|nr:hypothetical protein FO519_004914 [Halicephalobus sp. NKZ332]
MENKKNNESEWRYFVSLKDYLAIKDYAFLCIGSVLAIFTGAGIPHLVCVVGWLLNVFVMVEPTSEVFRSKTTPLLLYFVSASIVLGIIAFLQFFCFRLVALKVSRRIRRKYFQLLVSQKIDFFQNTVSGEENSRFEGDIEKFSKALMESLPNLVSTVSQMVSALLISLNLSTRLSLPIMGLGLFCIFWFSAFNLFLNSESKREQKINKKTLEALKTSSGFRSHCETQFSSGIKKSVFSGILAGSSQLFIYSSMGLGALYGNWLIDNDLLIYPGSIFIIACTIVPASMRFGQIFLNFSNFYELRSIFKHFQKFAKKESNSTVIQIDSENPPEYWPNSELKRKNFILSFFKNEVGFFQEGFRQKNSSIFIQLKKSAFKKKLYGLGFLFCLVFAVAPPTFTKLNGDLYEFYQIGRTEPFFSDGVTISWKYLVAGVITCLAGILCTIIYTRNGELIAKEVRFMVYTDFTTKYGPNLSEPLRRSMVPLILKSANQCKSVFDSRLSAFTVGVFSLAFGFAFVFEKNVPSAFVCSICFGLQAMVQYFIFRIADVQLKRAVSEKNEKAKTSITAFENMTDAEVRDKLPEIRKGYDGYLRFAFHRLSSVIGTEALRFAFIVAVPQVTQAISYVVGCFLVVEGLVRPVVLYKVVQTLYMSAFSIATIAQFNTDVHQARIGAVDLNDVIGEDDLESHNSSIRSGANIVHPSAA